MTKDPLDFLEGDEPREEVIEEQNAPIAEEAQSEAKEADKSEATANEAKGQPKPETETESQHGQHIPLTAHLAEREKRQEAVAKQEAAERRAEQLERQLNQFRAEQQQKRKPVDPLDDLDGFHQSLESQRIQDRIEMSEDLARMHHGDELVDAAQKWAEEQAMSNPVMAQQLQALGRQRNPYAHLLKLYRENQTVAEIGGDLEAYKAKLRKQWEEEMRAQQAETVANVSATSQRKPPASLAAQGSAASASNHVPTTDEVFDQLFG